MYDSGENSTVLILESREELRLEMSSSKEILNDFFLEDETTRQGLGRMVSFALRNTNLPHKMFYYSNRLYFR